MSTSQSIRTIKQLASTMTSEELYQVVGWCHRLAQKKERDEKGETSNGIALKSVLKAFRKGVPFQRGQIALPEAASGGTAMLIFYEETRVKGCRFEDDADMLLVQWGAEGEELFVSFTRQLIPPKSGNQIWQLTLDYRYPAGAGVLKNFSSGNRWFRSLHQAEAFNRFVHTSRVIAKFDKMQPTRIGLTYENVE